MSIYVSVYVCVYIYTCVYNFHLNENTPIKSMFICVIYVVSLHFIYYFKLYLCTTLLYYVSYFNLKMLEYSIFES